MKTRLIFAAIMMAFIGNSLASDKIIASDFEIRKGGYCISNIFKGAESIFLCEHIGRVTIKEIYNKGWRVVLKRDVHNVPSSMGLIIEQQ